MLRLLFPSDTPSPEMSFRKLFCMRRIQDSSHSLLLTFDFPRPIHKLLQGILLYKFLICINDSTPERAANEKQYQGYILQYIIYLQDCSF